jgi:hypothetical protein
VNVGEEREVKSNFNRKVTLDMKKDNRTDYEKRDEKNKEDGVGKRKGPWGSGGGLGGAETEASLLLDF